MFKKYLGLILRIGIAAVLIFGGVMKLFLSSLDNVVDNYTNQQSGYLSQYFLSFIASPTNFMIVVGWFQIALGILILLGLFTQLFVIITGVLSWISIVISPVMPAEIRMQKNLAFMGICFALAYTGAGPYSFDALFLNKNLKPVPVFRMILGLVLLGAAMWFYPYLQFAKIWNFLLLIVFIVVPLLVMFAKANLDKFFKEFKKKFSKDIVAVMLRFSLAYPLLASALFFVSFNRFPGIPQLLLLFIAVFLMLGLFTRLFSLVTIVVLIIQIFKFGVLAGADFALLAAAIVLLFVGGGKYNIVKKIRE